MLNVDSCSDCEYALLADVLDRLHVSRDEFLQQTRAVVYRVPRRRFEQTLTSLNCASTRSSHLLGDERRHKQTLVSGVLL